MSDLGELFDSAKRAATNMALSEKDEIAIKLILIHIIDRTRGRCREETAKLLLELIEK